MGNYSCIDALEDVGCLQIMDLENGAPFYELEI